MVPQKYLDLLKEFVAIKSISTDPKFKSDMLKTANWLSSTLKDYGFKTEEISLKEANPVVFAEYIADPSFETILIYGHYDVQPATKSDGWQSEPFEISQDSEKIYGRGSIDNKGQVLIHIYTIGELIKSGKLQYNVKFMIEGNEETGNEELSELIENQKEKFSCDYVMISDGETVQDRPTLDVGLRGGANMTLKFKTAKTNLHSGIYGGAVPNPVHELALFISKLYDENNKVAIPGFYNGVTNPTPLEMANNQKMKFDEAELEKLTGIKAFKKESAYDFYTQTGLRPMVTVSGIKGGYIDEGYANIVPAEAEIRINFRYVLGQRPEEIAKAFEEFIKANTPDYVVWQLEKSSSWGAVKINIDQPKVQEVLALLKETYGDEPVLKFVGGSIPAILDFKTILGKDTISVSMAGEDCNMHGVDENFKVSLLEKGLEFSRRFFAKE